MVAIQRFDNVQEKLPGGGPQGIFSLLMVIYPGPLRVTLGFYPPSPLL